jgi:CHASE3 domain sensor protein
MSSYEKLPLPEIVKTLEKIEQRLKEIEPSKRKFVIFGEPKYSESQANEIAFLEQYRKDLQKVMESDENLPEAQVVNG